MSMFASTSKRTVCARCRGLRIAIRSSGLARDLSSKSALLGQRAKERIAAESSPVRRVEEVGGTLRMRRRYRTATATSSAQAGEVGPRSPMPSSPSSMMPSAAGCEDVSVQLREVMRDVAQPVAIVTACTPLTPPAGSEAPLSASHPTSRYHGATLTSFTSLTLHPHPLVAFSLRLPSRLADCIRPDAEPALGPSLPRSASATTPTLGVSEAKRDSRSGEANDGYGAVEKGGFWSRIFGGSPSAPASPAASPPPNPSTPSGPLPSINPTASPKHLTVSLLSSASQPLAHALSSRLTPADQARLFASDEWDSASPPGLRGAVGRLRCEVVSSIVLKDVCTPAPAHTPLAEAEGEAGKTGAGGGAHSVGSELFICKVISVDKGPRSAGDRPLLYWKQQYATVKDDR